MSQASTQEMTGETPDLKPYSSVPRFGFQYIEHQTNLN
jgi:hypothetical protein